MTTKKAGAVGRVLYVIRRGLTVGAGDYWSEVGPWEGYDWQPDPKRAETFTAEQLADDGDGGLVVFMCENGDVCHAEPVASRRRRAARAVAKAGVA